MNRDVHLFFFLVICYNFFSLDGDCMAASFMVECDKKLDYIDELEEKLKQESSRILSFFELDGLKQQKKIKIWTDREKYRRYLEQYVDKYYEWMDGDTHDGNINMLSIEECRKTKSHQDMILEEMLEVITHEFVHACQQEINPDADNVEWFWEALATNLANPFDHVASMQCEDDELIYHLNVVPYSYPICFTIGKFMLESYSHETIMDYVRNPDKLRKDAKTIFKEEREWFRKKYLPLPSSPKAENEDFMIFAADKLDDFTTDCIATITEQKQKILDFLGLDRFRKVEVNLFDNQETFLNFIKKLRWSKAKIPEYCRGTYDNNMVNLSITTPIENPRKLMNAILHEFIHIIYNLQTDRRVVWLDEGLAMNLSGEKNGLLDDESLKSFITQKILPMNLPSDMNQLNHGAMFVNEEYNGYDLSYLAVRYLLETKSKNEIHEIIRNSDKALELGKDVLPCAMSYYSNKLFINSNIKTIR